MNNIKITPTVGTRILDTNLNKTCQNMTDNRYGIPHTGINIKPIKHFPRKNSWKNLTRFPKVRIIQYETQFDLQFASYGMPEAFSTNFIAETFNRRRLYYRTWFTVDKVLRINGYNTVRLDRADGYGGLSILYVKKDIHFAILEKITPPSNIQCIGIHMLITTSYLRNVPPRAHITNYFFFQTTATAQTL
jgi:hypothetical protein